MIGSKIIVGSQSKVWDLNLQSLSMFYCRSFVILDWLWHICTFVFEEMVALLVMDVKTCLWSELENKQWPGEVCSKKYKNKVYCLWTVGTEGVVLYRNQWTVHFIMNIVFYCRKFIVLAGTTILDLNLGWRFVKLNIFIPPPPCPRLPYVLMELFIRCCLLLLLFPSCADFVSGLCFLSVLSGFTIILLRKIL